MAGITARTVQKRLRELADPDYVAQVQRFFKCGKGEYGEGDIFLGLRLPVIRTVVGEFSTAPLSAILKLLASRYHEDRMCALLLMVKQYERNESVQREQLFNAYLANTDRINNWDLVDCSAAQIVGAHLQNGDRSLLHTLALSSNLWERRIAMVACYRFIRDDDHDDALAIAKLLLADDHDLIHKAVGWMLREVGKRDQECEMEFLDNYYQSMSRTTLRYAIERFPAPLRQAYLKGLRS